MLTVVFPQRCHVFPQRFSLRIFGISSCARCGSFGIASVLQQFLATSTCCIVTFSFIGGTTVLEFLQPFFLVLNNANHGRSDHEPEILFDAEPAGSNRFSPLRLLRRRKWAIIFLAGFRPDIEKTKNLFFTSLLYRSV